NPESADTGVNVALVPAAATVPTTRLPLLSVIRKVAVVMLAASIRSLKITRVDVLTGMLIASRPGPMASISGAVLSGSRVIVIESRPIFPEGSRAVIVTVVVPTARLIRVSQV